MTDYKHQLWEEIARNDPPTAKFIRDMNVNFGARLGRYFRWTKEPNVVLCKVYYRPRVVTEEIEAA